MLIERNNKARWHKWHLQGFCGIRSWLTSAPSVLKTLQPHSEHVLCPQLATLTHLLRLALKLLTFSQLFSLLISQLCSVLHQADFAALLDILISKSCVVKYLCILILKDLKQLLKKNEDIYMKQIHRDESKSKLQNNLYRMIQF